MFSIGVKAVAGKLVVEDNSFVVLCAGKTRDRRAEEARKQAIGMCCATLNTYPGCQIECSIQNADLDGETLKELI